MTILQSNTVTGLEYSDVKPSTKARMLEQMAQIAKDQTALFKMITNNDAPETLAAGQATGHIHDGTNGSILPMPLAQDFCNLRILSDTDLNKTDSDWQKCIMIPFYVQDNVTEINVLMHFQSLSEVENIRTSIYSDATTSLSDANSSFNLRSEIDGISTYEKLHTVTPDSINILVIEAWRGTYAVNSDSTPIFFCELKGYSILPAILDPHLVQNHSSNFGDNAALFPSASQYSSSYFTSFDDAMFADDRALSSYIVNSLNMNDTMLSELISGHAAGSRSTKTLTGHTHEGHASDLDKSGADLSMSLGSWSYGCANGVTANDVSFDALGVVSSPFLGTHVCFTLDSTTTTTTTLAEHMFRLPATKSTRVTSGTSEIRGTLLIYADNAKSGTVTVTMTLVSLAGVAGTSKTTTTTATGRQLLTIDNLEVPAGSPTSGESTYLLRIAIKQASTTAAAACVYASCIHLN